MKYVIKVYSIWEYGQRKDAAGNPHQEDSLYPPFGRQTDADRTFILCDGMGGHDAGEVASATVCETMARSIRNDGHDDKGEFTVADFNDALTGAFDALDAKDTGAEKKMGTTLAFLKLHNQGATVAHIGDSRVYHIRPGKDGPSTRILFHTEDHSLVQELVKLGEMTRAEARSSKQKNVITRAMQPLMERRPRADVYETADIRPGDFFYLCSDGMLEQPEMDDGISLCNIFSQQVTDDLRRVEILKGATQSNRDNHTAIIVHVLEVIDPIPVPAPSAADGASGVSPMMAEVHDDTPPSAGTASSQPRASRQYYAPQRKKRGTQAVITAILAVVALVLVCICLFVLFKEPSPTVEKKDEAPVKTEKTDTPVKTKPKGKAAGQIKSVEEQQKPIEEKVADPEADKLQKTGAQIAEEVKGSEAQTKAEQKAVLKEKLDKVANEEVKPSVNTDVEKAQIKNNDNKKDEKKEKDSKEIEPIGNSEQPPVKKAE